MSVITSRVATIGGAGASQVSGSFTPDAGERLVVLTLGTGNARTITSVTSSVGGLPSFLAVASFVWAHFASDRIACYIADANDPGGTPRTITVAYNLSVGGSAICVLGVTGINKAGLLGVRQSAIQNPGSAAATPAPVFPAPCLSSNPVIGFLNNAQNPAAMTEPAGFAEYTDTGFAPLQGVQTVGANSGFSSDTLTWGSASPVVFAAFGVELDATVLTDTMLVMGMLGTGRV